MAVKAGIPYLSSLTVRGYIADRGEVRVTFVFYTGESGPSQRDWCESTWSGVVSQSQLFDLLQNAGLIQREEVPA